MKKLWARIGRTYEVSDEVYEKICEEVRKNNPGAVAELLAESTSYDSGEDYLPVDCDDNPNTEDFEF